ncbi:MAG: flavin reductase [Thermofilum sp. ex4484_79]|nr:MAG: flavin reductase [Thermofilum sp. ex4484_79]HDD64315.1 flavin reductase family protein [Thermoprotei archaeon]
MEFVSIPLSSAHRLLHPQLAVLITVRGRDGKANVMTAAWCMPVSHRPPLVCVSIAPKRFTHRLIVESGEFAINIPSLEMLKIVDLCGTCSGAQVNKFKKFNLPTVEAKVINAPIISSCIAFIECKVVNSVKAGDHTLFIGKIVAAYTRGNIFDKIYMLDKCKLPLHLGGDMYTTCHGVYRP